jgi:hypothetical protein
MTALRAPTMEEALQVYFREGEARAGRLANRGPLRFAPDGGLHPDILEAYQGAGLYVFEGLFAAEELKDLQADFADLLQRLPTQPGGETDAEGRPALGADRRATVLAWSKPLGDPFGGTAAAGGRHPVKMFEPEPAKHLPAEVPFSILGVLQFSDAALRAYAHPGLLAIAAAINGPDFVPFTEGFLFKKPGEGCSFAWHQDGMTLWDSPDWDPHCHGFNFMLQLYGCTSANGLWYIPGSHAMGKVDIAGLVERSGGNLLADAVPLVCAPGDVAISNRQLVHGSFPNTSPDLRVTLQMGFHRRRSVLGARFTHEGRTVTHDAERLRTRSEMIGYAIAARRQRFPEEASFAYRPHAETGERYQWDEAARLAIRDYNLLDIGV